MTRSTAELFGTPLEYDTDLGDLVGQEVVIRALRTYRGLVVSPGSLVRTGPDLGYAARGYAFVSRKGRLKLFLEGDILECPGADLP